MDSSIHSACFQGPIDYLYNVIFILELADIFQDWDRIELGMISFILLLNVEFSPLIPVKSPLAILVAVLC